MLRELIIAILVLALIVWIVQKIRLMTRITALRIKLSGENVGYYISLMDLKSNKPNENIIAAFALLKDDRSTVKSSIFSYAAEHYPHLNKAIVEYLESVGISTEGIEQENHKIRKERVMQRFAEIEQSQNVERYKSKLEKIKEEPMKDYSKTIPGLENEFKDNFDYIIYALRESSRKDTKEILENLYINADYHWDSEYLANDFLLYGLGMSSDEIKRMHDIRSARKNEIEEAEERSRYNGMTKSECLNAMKQELEYRDAYDPGSYSQYKDHPYYNDPDSYCSGRSP